VVAIGDEGVRSERQRMDLLRKSGELFS
jgi:hypothetical protein